MNKISIIGLGWIGLPLAKLLLEKNVKVIGSSTTSAKASSLQNLGIPSIHFALDPHPIGSGFHQLFQGDVIVLNIPPRSRQDGGEKYLEQLKFLTALLNNSPIQKVLYVSSTGVYPEDFRSEEYTEEEAISLSTAGNPALWKAERYLLDNLEQDLTIVRFGGLLGDDRIPGRYFSGKENVIGHTRVNYIYRNDAVQMMHFILANELWGKTFNGVAPLHPLRKEVYEKNAQDLGIAPPASFAPENPAEQRLVSSQKIIDSGFEFTFPDPLDFPYQQ
ncbi:Rossmann-fold NAD(P)-binding domain-containing protein [Algoriphagus hitonicola]|uniref:Nucleoside-diphosphate-sugar epimerase n=1 Tax=Algoriphagus hitonicola TaxID=435880 RepID=A0A1I2U652_9BACT|nr:epimerase [Algoriphagus hitonicola]SFG72604.1 Nucleoside-diphosphate-sugar epimerase [Algoriphagus hitonicola]